MAQGALSALHTTTDVAEIKRLLDGVLAVDPVANTIFSSILAGLDRDNAAGWAAHPIDAPLVLAARSQVHTPVALASGWTDTTELAAAIAALDPPAAAVAGAPDLVAGVVSAIGRAPIDRMAERLFVLDALIAPADVVGEPRLATPEHLDLLCEWYTAFAIEAFGRLHAGFDARTAVERGLRISRCWLWSVDNVPLSMAVRHPPAHGVSRIGPVYTPPEHRRHGYGSAVTARASADILGDGHTPCLFTDLANPTSNKIYQDLGFRPVLDRASVRCVS